MRYLPPALRYCQTMLLIGCAVLTRNMYAADLQQLTADNYASLVPAGKETDAILGDWVLRNDQIVVVIAQPVAGRNANMTVRGVSGMIIDLTRRSHASDQLGCFYPAGGSYLFDSADSLKITAEDQPVDLSNGKPIRAKSIQFSLVGRPITGNQTEARVTYILRDGQAWLEYQVEVTNKSDAGQKLTAQASLRCDGTIFRFGNDEATRLFYAEDAYFGQCYGFIPNDGVFKLSGGAVYHIFDRRDGRIGTKIGHGCAFSRNKLHFRRNRFSIAVDDRSLHATGRRQAESFCKRFVG